MSINNRNPIAINGRLRDLVAALGCRDFPLALVRCIAETLGVRLAAVIEAERELPGSLRPVAVWCDGRPLESPRLPVMGSPFECVDPQRPSFLASQGNLADRFPDCEWVQHVGARYFRAVKSKDTPDRPTVYLAVLDDKEEQPPDFEEWLVLFAQGLFRELEHIRTPKDEELLLGYQQQLKELNCIYGLAESLRTRERIEEICEDVVRLLPLAWRFPQYARARIILDERVYVSEPFEETPWGHSAAIVANDRTRGMVQVFYAQEVPQPNAGGPFLAAERKLLDAVARTLGEAVHRHEVEADNRRKTVILAQERYRLETILRGIGEGVVVTDVNDRVLMMNVAAQSLLGHIEREPIGENFLGLVGDEQFRESWRSSMIAGVHFAKQDLRVETGRVRTLSATRSRIPELIQGEDCYVTILHDVTREREIEQMKSDFISAVSHELRTPLTSIRGFATTLLRNPSMAPDKRNQFLKIIDEESERLMQLIESLLAMGSIEAGRLVLDLAPVNIEQIVRTLDLSLARSMTAKHIKYERDIEKGLPPVIADGKRLHTIIGNLLENAVKFTPERGRVTLRIRRENDHVVITVRDTGVGIPRDQLPRIFERFYQAQSGNQKVPGAGLGLFLVKEMVTLHQGTIAVESEPGQGTTFTVRLPLAPAAAQARG